MELISPSLYREYVSVGNNRKKILYVRLQKALYGRLYRNLLFYCKLKGEIETFGFLLNPYDSYVSNKWVNGRKMTATWNVYDIKYHTRMQVR